MEYYSLLFIMKVKVPPYLFDSWFWLGWCACLWMCRCVCSWICWWVCFWMLRWLYSGILRCVCLWMRRWCVFECGREHVLDLPTAALNRALPRLNLLCLFEYVLSQYFFLKKKIYNIKYILHFFSFEGENAILNILLFIFLWRWRSLSTELYFVLFSSFWAISFLHRWIP